MFSDFMTFIYELTLESLPTSTKSFKVGELLNITFEDMSV